MATTSCVRAKRTKNRFIFLGALNDGQKPKHDWQATFAMFADDPDFDEVLSLGGEFRQKENKH